MSELKARLAYFSEDDYDKGAHKICAKVSDCGYDRRNEWWSYAFEDEVYLKPEADKVIRHHKFKRCLAMAKICENKLGTVVKPGWWDKWRKRWLELAELYKRVEK